MELETAFYIIGIVFMSLMLLITLFIFVVALRLKQKIDHIHSAISKKVELARDITGKAGIIFNTVRYFIAKGRT